MAKIRIPLLFVNALALVSMASVASMHSAYADSKVIDLGEMSVNGEIRRPSITWIDSQKPVKEALPGIFRTELEAFEARLLEPAPMVSSTEAVTQEKPLMKPLIKKGEK